MKRCRMRTAYKYYVLYTTTKYSIKSLAESSYTYVAADVQRGRDNARLFAFIYNFHAKFPILQALRKGSLRNKYIIKKSPGHRIRNKADVASHIVNETSPNALWRTRCTILLRYFPLVKNVLIKESRILELLKTLSARFATFTTYFRYV